MKIGVMFGNPETTRAAMPSSSMHRSGSKCASRDDLPGRGQCDRQPGAGQGGENKVAPPFRKAEIEIMFGKGISASGSLLDAAVEHDIISKTGSWYSFGADKIGQGRENAKLFLESNPDVFGQVENKLKAVLFSGQTEGASSQEQAGKKAVQNAEKNRLNAG